MTFVTGIWSDEELETVETMAAAGEPKAEIAKVVNRDYRSVVSKLAHLAKKAREAAKPQRVCLKCRELFASSWIGNRLCRRCNNPRPWDSTPRPPNLKRLAI